MYNIGSTEEVSILELAQRVKRMTESQSALRLIPYDQAYAKGFDQTAYTATLEKVIGLID